MRIFVAGATGAIGRPLVRQLLARGHDVIALTRRDETASSLRAQGIQVVVGDALDRDRIARALRGASPDALAIELTDLPKQMNPRKLREYYAANNRVRLEGTSALLEVAKQAGVRRVVSQSAAFWYSHTGGNIIRDEACSFDEDAPEPLASAIRTIRQVETTVKATSGMEGVNLRYGMFYGPGTWYSFDGEIGRRMRNRQYPMIGKGDAVSSFIHIEDAAAATVATLESTIIGDYNVVDDDPAPAREWMPAFARAVHAPGPLRVPVFLARLVVGDALIHLAVHSQGASNARLKAAVDWAPRFSSWRTGFIEGLK